MELTATFMTLLEGFMPVFTSPSFVTFQSLMNGWILSTRHRYVTDLIISSDSVDNGHFSDYHRFFSHAVWSIDKLWRLLATLVIDTFIGKDAVIILAADDTLCRKRGLTTFGAGMHHDPLVSSRAKKIVSWGHDWVILSIIITNCRWAPSKVFALPICARLYRNRQGLTKGQKEEGRQSRASQSKTDQAKSHSKQNPDKNAHRTRPELLSEMLALVASWFPDRRFHVVVDSLYSGKSVLSQLPENMDLTGPVHSKGALYAPAPKQMPGRGRPRKKGERLPTRDEWAANKTRWRRVEFDQYGLHGTFQYKTREGLYYKAGKDRRLKLVLTRDTDGDRPTRIFYSTDLNQSVKQMLSLFSYRWSTEVMHFDVKQFLGFEDPANRVPKAVERTAPMALFLYTLTIVWYETEGKRHVRFPKRPWYRTKTEPSFRDMLTTLRRVTWEEQLSEVQKKPARAKKRRRLLTFLATLAG